MVHSEVHLLIFQAFSQLHEMMSTSQSQMSFLPDYSKRHFSKIKYSLFPREDKPNLANLVVLSKVQIVLSLPMLW